ncbi:MAG: DEAD/DEAH box helicase [Marinifilaceae bacterium]
MKTKLHTAVVGAMNKAGITTLRPIQEEMLSVYNKTDNIMLLSPTGSGKTLAFLLPLLQNLNSNNKHTQALILAPSRELAQQIERVFRSLGSGNKVVCCYGGHSLRFETDQLIEPPVVLIGTPGRILDHMVHKRIDTASINCLVLDEFDKCLELGFTEEMEAIITQLPSINKRVLTSATNAEIPEYTGMVNTKILDYTHKDKTNSVLEVKQLKSYEADKLPTLLHLLCDCPTGQKIIFCNYRESVERISNYLEKNNFPNSPFHGGMEQAERERALIKFRNGSTNIIVSTDLAARGLDIPDIKEIIHYHLPLSPESYTHRNGRTARMGATGVAILLVGPDEFLPEYVPQSIPYMSLSDDPELPQAAEWVTLYIGKGKRDKLSRIDIVGFLIKQGLLQKEDIGLIELKELHAYVAIPAIKAQELIKRIRNEKIKKMKTKFEISY